LLKTKYRRETIWAYRHQRL